MNVILVTGSYVSWVSCLAWVVFAAYLFSVLDQFVASEVVPVDLKLSRASAVHSHVSHRPLPLAFASHVRNALGRVHQLWAFSEMINSKKHAEVKLIGSYNVLKEC